MSALLLTLHGFTVRIKGISEHSFRVEKFEGQLNVELEVLPLQTLELLLLAARDLFFGRDSKEHFEEFAVITGFTTLSF